MAIKKTSPKRRMYTFEGHPDDRKLITDLRNKLGANISSLIRMGLRLLAEKEGLRAA